MDGTASKKLARTRPGFAASHSAKVADMLKQRRKIFRKETKEPDSYSLEASQESREVDLASEEQAPDARVLDEELHKALKLAIEQLPETLRTPFLLRSIEGLRTKEAARRLGIIETTLKVRLHRARQELRKFMHSYLQEDAPFPFQVREK